MVGMGVADKDELVLRPMGIEPKPEAREINPALPELKIKPCHAYSLGQGRPASNCWKVVGRRALTGGKV
jgi:hypothetical protein